MTAQCLCGKLIEYRRHLGIEAWRHGTGSEFCNRYDNDLQRADPQGEETR